MTARTHSSDGRCLDHGRLCCGTCPPKSQPAPDLNAGREVSTVTVLDSTGRYALAAAVMQEVFRDYYGRIWQHRDGGIHEARPDVAAALNDLEVAGLVTCPPPAGRTDRYFEITDKALEA